MKNLSWGLLDKNKAETEENLQLISSSLDHNIILWANKNNLWININR